MGRKGEGRGGSGYGLGGRPERQGGRGCWVWRVVRGCPLVRALCERRKEGCVWFCELKYKVSGVWAPKW